MNENKYPYPFRPEVLANRDVNGGRENARKLERWYFLKEQRKSDITTRGVQITIEPDTLVFVDEKDGIIKLNIRERRGILMSIGGIYNPQKGTETLQALLDILAYIAHVTQKRIEYRTQRVNRTVSLSSKLILIGFQPENGEFVVSVDPSDSARHQYNELDPELARLGFLVDVQ